MNRRKFLLTSLLTIVGSTIIKKEEQNYYYAYTIPFGRIPDKTIIGPTIEVPTTLDVKLYTYVNKTKQLI